MRIIRFCTLKIFYKINDSKAICLNSFLSLLIGIIIFFITDKTSYDLRFQIRGVQSVSQRVFLFTISPYEWRTLKQKMALKYSAPSQWELDLWNLILDALNKGRPRSIGIIFSFIDEKPSLLIKNVKGL